MRVMINYVRSVGVIVSFIHAFMHYMIITINIKYIRRFADDRKLKTYASKRCSRMRLLRSILGLMIPKP